MLSDCGVGIVAHVIGNGTKCIVHWQNIPGDEEIICRICDDCANYPRQMHTRTTVSDATIMVHNMLRASLRQLDHPVDGPSARRTCMHRR